MKVETFFEKIGRRDSMGKVKGMTAALLLGCVTFALPVSASGTNVQIDAEPIWGATWQGLLGAQRVIRK